MGRGIGVMVGEGKMMVVGEAEVVGMVEGVVDVVDSGEVEEEEVVVTGADGNGYEVHESRLFARWLDMALVGVWEAFRTVSVIWEAAMMADMCTIP